jgi:hypothetical protein
LPHGNFIQIAERQRTGTKIVHRYRDAQDPQLVQHVPGYIGVTKPSTIRDPQLRALGQKLRLCTGQTIGSKIVPPQNYSVEILTVSTCIPMPGAEPVEGT